MNSKHPLSAARMSRILEALTEKPMHAHDLAGSIYLSVRWVYSYLTHMHNAGLIHVKTWDRREAGNKYPVAVYAAGPGIDKKKPPRMTSAQKEKGRRKARKSDPVELDLYRAAERARKRKVARMDLVAALFGPPVRRAA